MYYYYHLKIFIYFWLYQVFVPVWELSLVVVLGLSCSTACGIFLDQE